MIRPNEKEPSQPSLSPEVIASHGLTEEEYQKILRPFTCLAKKGELLRLPVKNGEGCYYTDASTLERLRKNRQILLRYVDSKGKTSPSANPNGSVDHIAGVCNEGRNVFGLMPHPEHAAEKILGNEDGLKIFSSVMASCNTEGKRV